MSASQKGGRAKPQLRVEIEDFERRVDEFKEGNGNNVTTKPLLSHKNAHELKRFAFEPPEPASDRKLHHAQQLEYERTQLIHSLEVLRASAVSAIAEKDDEIEKLRSVDHLGLEERLELYENELYQSKRAQGELEQEREQICREFAEERSRHLAELEEKEYLIEALHEEIGEIRSHLDQLEQHDQAKAKRIRLLQDENSSLTAELEHLSLASSLSHLTPSASLSHIDQPDLDETLKIAPSVASSIHSQRCKSAVEGEWIEEVNRSHREELAELRGFYEKRMSALREIYERELNLPTEESEDSRSHSSRLTRKPSRRSLRRAQPPSDGLALNLRDMYAIEEHAEEVLETERTKMHDLRYEIKMQNLSECPSRPDDDANSHFTAKYFDLPARFLKKNRSSSTFNPEEKTVLKLNRRVDTEEKPDEEEIDTLESADVWSRAKVFAAGVLSGVTVTALTALFLKRH